MLSGERRVCFLFYFHLALFFGCETTVSRTVRYNTIRYDRRSRHEARREGETEGEQIEEEDLKINSHGIAIPDDLFRPPNHNLGRRHQWPKSSKRREPPANTRSPPSEASTWAGK